MACYKRMEQSVDGCSSYYMNIKSRIFEVPSVDQLPLFDLMAYAVHCWPAHYRKAIEQGLYAEAILEYLKDKTLFRFGGDSSLDSAAWMSHQTYV